jgi:hypothetical protein
MPDNHRETDSNNPRSAMPPAMPGWVKGLGIALLVLVVIVVVVMLLGGGEHGPGMHG